MAEKLNQKNKWSTLSLSMGLFKKAFESFREWRTPELMKNSIPYPLTKAYDMVSEMQIGGPLPKEFKEERYFIMKGPIKVATLDTAFHQDEGLVNFSFLIKLRELFKKKAAIKIFHDYVIPYVREHVGKEDWREFLPGQYFIIDRKRSLVITAKFYFNNPQKCFGLALMELKYSGIGIDGERETDAKKKVTEMEAASLFLIPILKNSKEKWPFIAEKLNKLFEHKEFKKTQFAAMEFCFAVIALQTLALPNLLELEKAERILEYILTMISNPELGTYPRDMIKKYQDEWNAYFKRSEPPYYGIASVLYDALECKKIYEVGDEKYKDPIVLMLLAEEVMMFSDLKWWKDLIENYDIVKDELPGIEF